MASAAKVFPLLWLCIFMPPKGALQNPQNPGIPSLHSDEESAREHGQAQADENNGGTYCLYNLKPGTTNEDKDIKTMLLVDYDIAPIEGPPVEKTIEPEQDPAE